MLESIVNLALGSARVLPAIEMLRDFSESAEQEAKAGATALFFLGLSLGLGAMLLLSGLVFMGLSHFWLGGAALILSAPCAYVGHRCKLRLDETRSKLEQLKAAAIGARAARAVASKTMDMGLAAFEAVNEAVKSGREAVKSGRDAATQAARRGASMVATPPNHGIATPLPAPGLLAHDDEASVSTDLTHTSEYSPSEANNQTATELASQTMHGVARSAGHAVGHAVGWLKTKSSVHTK